MIFILLWLTKLKSVLITILTFIIEHWQVFLVAAICLYAFYYKTAYEREKVAFEAYKSNIAQQAKMQQVKNEILRKQAQDDRDGLIAEHKRQLAEAGLERDKVTKNLKGSINEINNELNIYRDAIGVRNSTSSIGVSTLAEDTLSTSITSGNCHESLATVIDACKVTDYDYEALYNLYKKQCNIYGCE